MCSYSEISIHVAGLDLDLGLVVLASTSNHGRRKQGYAGDLTSQLFMWGDIDMHITPRKI